METTKISKTQQYRKVMKPMLERKRRARINKCLDQLKDLIIQCMKEDDEHILKLEKADILEHTVEYLHKIKSNEINKTTKQETKNTDDNIKESFRNGYIYAANEVSKILATTRGVNTNFGIQLMSHLGYKLNNLTTSTTNTSNQLESDIKDSKHEQQTHFKSSIINETQQQKSYYTQYNKQQELSYQQQRSYSPLSVNISALSPVSSGYHSSLSSPTFSEDSTSSLSSLPNLLKSNDYNTHQNYIIKNKFNNIATIYNNDKNNKENVWRPW